MRRANLSKHLYGLFIFISAMCLLSVFSSAAAGASLADLAGTWNLSSLVTGPGAPFWGRATLTVTSNGKFTGSATESDSDKTNNMTGAFALSSGGFLLKGPGITSEVLCQIDLGKTVLACTQTWPKSDGSSAGSTALMVGTKQAAPGSYSNDDLVAADWEANMLDSGPTDPSWIRLSYDTIYNDGSFQASYSDSNGNTASLSGQVAISTNGEITCVTGECPDPNFTSYMDASKSVIVGMYGVSATTADAVLTVFTKMAESYSMADLAGIWEGNSLSSGSEAPRWERSTLNFNPNGTFTTSNVESDGSKSTKTGTFSISPDGVITIGAQNLQNSGLVMNAGKTVMVVTDTPDSGSATIKIFTKSAGVPGAPTIGAVTPENAEAKVSFTPPASDGGSAITGYTVTSPTNSSIKTTGKSSPILVKGLTNGTPYTFTVAATNNIGIGPASSPSNPPVTPATKPDAPTIGTITAGSGQATVSFTEQSDGGSPTTYTVTSNPKGGVDTNAASTSLRHIVTNLKSGKKYTFTVTATNAVGASTSKPSKPITIE